MANKSNYEQVKHGLQLVFQWDGKDVDTNINEIKVVGTDSLKGEKY